MEGSIMMVQKECLESSFNSLEMYAGRNVDVDKQCGSACGPVIVPVFKAWRISQV
jgi:hypothetical protein